MKETLGADGFPNDLKVKCPHCERALRPLDFMRHAITLSRRTCQQCRAVWRVQATPQHIKVGIATILDWTLIGRKERGGKEYPA
jgi:glutaredoxin